MNGAASRTHLRALISVSYTRYNQLADPVNCLPENLELEINIL